MAGDRGVASKERLIFGAQTSYADMEDAHERRGRAAMRHPLAGRDGRCNGSLHDQAGTMRRWTWNFSKVR